MEMHVSTYHPLLDSFWLIGVWVWFVVGPGASGRAVEVPETLTDAGPGAPGARAKQKLETHVFAAGPF